MTELKRSITEMSTVGDQLRFARESRGLSQAEVSRALCLPVNVIDALERDAREALPPAVFVRGYIRNYAKFLRLSLDENEPETQSSIIAGHVPEEPSFVAGGLYLFWRLFLKVLNYIVVLTLLILLFIWWHDKQHAAEKELSLANMSIQEDPFPKLNVEIPPALSGDTEIATLRPWWPFEGEDNSE
jgi:cytoskeleton protein RodZ